MYTKSFGYELVPENALEMKALEILYGMHGEAGGIFKVGKHYVVLYNDIGEGIAKAVEMIAEGLSYPMREE